MTQLQTIAQNIDYKLLRAQKATLLELMDKPGQVVSDYLGGLVQFIDAFQDAVVEDGLVPSEDVFE